MRRLLRGFFNRACQVAALYAPGAYSLRVWLHRMRGVRIGKRTFAGTARLVQEKEEDAAARYLLAEKYQEWEDGKTLSEWARTALPVAIDLNPVRGE